MAEPSLRKTRLRFERGQASARIEHSPNQAKKIETFRVGSTTLRETV
jgi:hypothetical protein